MEGLIISAVVASLGYYLKDTDTKPNTSVSKNDLPSPRDIYHSNKVNEVNDEVLQMATDNYKKSQNPEQTGMIPPLYNVHGSIGNQTLMNNSTSFDKIMEPSYGIDLKQREKQVASSPMFSIGSQFNLTNDLPFSEVTPESTTTNPLTGLPYEKNHANMTPFFGGSVKQNMESFSNISMLDTYTGRGTFKPGKREVESFGDIKQENIYGMPVFSSTVDTSRFIPSSFKQGEKPFMDQKVAAPIAGTFENPLSQNFQKDVDSLRVLSNPKVTYEGRTKEGQKGSVRGLIGVVNKNTPDMSYQMGHDTLFTGPGSTVAHAMQRNFAENFKSTHREGMSEEYFGISDSNFKETYKQGEYQESTRNQLATDTELNVKGFNGMNSQSIINSYSLPGQQRDTTYDNTGFQTISGHLLPTLAVGDKQKNTKRQEYSDKYDNSGNLTSYVKIFNNVYSKAKETIKEQNLIENYKGGLKGNEYVSSSRDKYDNAEILTKKEELHSVRKTQMGSSGLGNIAKSSEDFGKIDRWKRNIHQDCQLDRTPSIEPTNSIINSFRNIGDVNLETKKTLVKDRLWAL